MKKEYFERPFLGYWTIGNCKSVDVAKSYNDLYLVAVQIIKIMPSSIIQFCGPISTGGKGSIDANIAEFNKAITFFSKKGMYVFDQIPFEESMHRIRALKGINGYDQDLLNQFYLPIFESKLIEKLVFLPGWESSIGSIWEYEQAKRLDIYMKFLPDNWYEIDYDLNVGSNVIKINLNY